MSYNLTDLTKDSQWCLVLNSGCLCFQLQEITKMKFLLTVAALIAVAVAVPTQRGLVAPGPAGPAPAPEDSFEPIAVGPAIIDSFEPIAVGPAIIDSFEPIAIGPAIVEGFEPIAVGPAIVDFPVADVVPSPVTVVEGTPTEVATGTPLVQIILNINQAASPVSVGPAETPVEIQPEPVHVVESAPEPVQVVEVAPVPAEPVQIGIPVLPEAAVVLPEELN
ncbi:hypothetical protein PYW08_005769 [Mythimna loreyi]|uniref:Uncharacterized protein n=1 Tax=Mythimna loreyi TaxID=667449 RepID=A0ACC2QI34_9NEOP|nr:hypothetical protein PYW08_005769 [Mythimna loreyi]